MLMLGFLVGLGLLVGGPEASAQAGGLPTPTRSSRRDTVAMRTLPVTGRGAIPQDTTGSRVVAPRDRLPVEASPAGDAARTAAPVELSGRGHEDPLVMAPVTATTPTSRQTAPVKSQQDPLLQLIFAELSDLLQQQGQVVTRWQDAGDTTRGEETVAASGGRPREVVGQTHRSAAAPGTVGSWSLTWWWESTTGAAEHGGEAGRQGADPGPPARGGTGRSQVQQTTPWWMAPQPGTDAPHRWPWQEAGPPSRPAGDRSAAGRVLRVVAVQWHGPTGQLATVWWLGSEAGTCRGRMTRGAQSDVMDRLSQQGEGAPLQRARWSVDPIAPLRLALPEPEALLLTLQQGGWNSWEQALTLGPTPCSQPWLGLQPQTWPSVAGRVGAFQVAVESPGGLWRGPWIGLQDLRGPLTQWSPRPGVVLVPAQRP